MDMETCGIVWFLPPFSFFIIDFFLSNLEAERGARTHDVEVKSGAPPTDPARRPWTLSSKAVFRFKEL